ISTGADIYDNPATPFVASFVGENNPFFGSVTDVNDDYAVIDTRFGALRGRNDGGLRPGNEAVLFIRPESLTLAGDGGDQENIIESIVLNEAFEGAVRHIYFRGENGKDITLSVTHDGTAQSFAEGDTARIAFPPARAVVLPRGPLADE
ncbi:MAG: TOBE domain-containing protein, partial [Kiloniellaceae bacterium]